MAHKDGSLSALVALIAEATAVVEAHFRASSKPYVPSLDDLEEHPLDNAVYTPELRKAVQTIEGACAQLTATVAKPVCTVVNMEHDILANNCLNIALRLKVADALLNKPNGLHISELAGNLGVDKNKLGRILRLLATRHIFREVATDVFANNRLSLQILSTNPIWSLGIQTTEEFGRCMKEIPAILKDPEWSNSTDPRQTALNRYTGFKGDLYQWLEAGTEEGVDKGAQFGIAMMGWATACEANSVIHAYPWQDLPNGASVCDVAGGVGNIALQLAKAYPHLQLRLQDLPERMVQARYEVWPQKCPEAIAENRIEFKAMDFFSESPVPGCDIYYLKNILHNWSDQDCITILKGVRRAMAPHSRVLIHEYILQHAHRTHTKAMGQPQAPEPLLANYGAGRIRQYSLDIIVMAILNAQERSLEGFIRLGEHADLQFVKVWDFGEMAAIEFRSGPGTRL